MTEKKLVKKEIPEEKKTEEESVEKSGPDKGITKNFKDGKKLLKELDVDDWHPKTSLGKEVNSGKIKDINEVFFSGRKIMDPEIAELLIPDLNVELLLIGQAKGKFGGGQRRVFKQTQKKTNEGNKPSFATFVVVGNSNGIIGIGYGKARETVPAREKAIRNAKLNIMNIRRGCGSWQCGCGEPHSIPFSSEGKCGSVRIKLLPAPKGTGLKIEKECQKVLAAAGIKDIWSRTLGQTRTKTNILKALVDAIKNLEKMKVNEQENKNIGLTEGVAVAVESAK